MTKKEEAQQIRMEDFDYPLADGRIAKFPLPERDGSKLLVYRDGEIGESRFRHLADYLPAGSLMVFNNTRVIRARLLFRKPTGARIELFCLEPAGPSDYESAFGQTERCRWMCLVGNLRRWKEGVLSREVAVGGGTAVLRAVRLRSCGDSHLVEFTWNRPDCTFADLLDAAGVLPIPPYLNREAEQSDLQTYQTFYSKVKGSVAAPTAGLHFTPEVLADIDAHGIGREEVTLHVGAGTFRPVKSATVGGHGMHTEFISVRRGAIERIKDNIGRIIAVGTTSVRTLESLYYIGVMLAGGADVTGGVPVVGQWMPYDEANNRLTAAAALQQIVDYLDRIGAERLVTATRIIIVPGYEFKIVRGLVTNFHQPKSTLLLLVSAFVKGDWKAIYEYALAHGFRFLSYGDSSLLL